MSDWTVTVSRVRVYEVALSLRTPFRISGGSMHVRRSLIVECQDDSGRRGYGESAPFELPFYSSETIASARSCLEEVFVPRIVGVEFADSSELRSELARGVCGNRMARAGIETAFWDLVARRRELPLAALVNERLRELGVAGDALVCRDRIECGVALGIPDNEDLAALEKSVRDAVRRGYRRVKLKVRPGWDHDPVCAAMRVMTDEGADVPVWVDANGAYDPEKLGGDLLPLDKLGLLFIEQPYPAENLWDSAQLQRVIDTPVCLDESLVSDDVARQIIAMGGPPIWNLKVQRLGGLEETCRVYARGVAADVRLWMGTMPETGVGAQATLAVAAHSACVYPTDVEPSERWYPAGVDLVELHMDDRGWMRVPEDEWRPSQGLNEPSLVFDSSR